MTPRQRARAKLIASKLARRSPSDISPFVLSDSVQPWERQPSESAIAYRAFQIFRDLEPAKRSLPKVAEILGQGGSSVSGFSRHNLWRQRAAAWDFHLNRARLAQSEMYQLDMSARHAEIAKMMLERVRERLATVKFNTLDHKTVAAWLEIGMQAERLSRGLNPEQTINHAHSLNVNLRQMTEAEIMAEINVETKRSGRPVLDIPIPEASLART